jgi:hypothetical protein
VRSFLAVFSEHGRTREESIYTRMNISLYKIREYYLKNYIININ